MEEKRMKNNPFANCPCIESLPKFRPPEECKWFLDELKKIQLLILLKDNSLRIK
jgi:hypothetical protein